MQLTASATMHPSQSDLLFKQKFLIILITTYETFKKELA